MRKSIVAAVAALSLVAGAGAATAKSGPQDDNPNNDKGQCTAFFNGQKKGQERPEDAVVEAIYDSCTGLIKGNPEENGRFPGCFDEDTDGDGNTCEDTEG